MPCKHVVHRHTFRQTLKLKQKKEEKNLSFHKKKTLKDLYLQVLKGPNLSLKFSLSYCYLINFHISVEEKCNSRIETILFYKIVIEISGPMIPEHKQSHCVTCNLKQLQNFPVLHQSFLDSSSPYSPPTQLAACTSAQHLTVFCFIRNCMIGLFCLPESIINCLYKVSVLYSLSPDTSEIFQA